MDINCPPQKIRRTDDVGMGQNPMNIPPAQAPDSPEAPPAVEPVTAAPDEMSRPFTYLRQYLEQNRRALSLMEKVTTADIDSKLKHVEAKAILQGLIDGISMTLEMMERVAGPTNPTRTTAGPSRPTDVDITAPTVPEAPWTTVSKPRRQNRDARQPVVPYGPNMTASPSRPPPVYKQALLKKKDEAMKKLAAMKPKPDAKRQVIYEPTNPEKRKEHISNLFFIRELASALIDTGLRNPVEALWRLPRGGFRIQLVGKAMEWLKEKGMPSIHTLSYGEWTHWTPKPTRQSVVMDPIHTDVSLEDLQQELKEPSAHIALTAADVDGHIHAMERMKYRDRTTGELRDSKKIRLYVDDELFKKLVSSGGFLLGYQSVHIREYQRPQYRCFNCNQVGTHRSYECRQPRRQQSSWADQMDTETSKDTRKRHNE